MNTTSTRYAWHASPVGRLLLAGSDDCLSSISFPSGRGARKPQPDWVEDLSVFTETIRQIDGYFTGELTGFLLPLAPPANEFAARMRQAMLAIPYGETATYGEIARVIGEPVSASRAVGTACGENPLPIVVPCHRVVGAGGALTGFGGGLETKQFLLDLEFRVRPPADTLFGVI